MTELVLHLEQLVATSVQIEAGLIGRAGERLAAVLPPPRKVLLVTDRDVAAYWLEPLAAALRAEGYEVQPCRVPAGEDSKSARMAGQLWDRALDFGVERSSVVVALGGGVVGDLAGFVAATLLRGLPLVQVPTSLLAQVDACVGGKTGINRTHGKNLVGAFWHPRLVLVDPECLRTLPAREQRAGLGEVVKYGLIRDPAILRVLARTGPDELFADRAALSDLVARCLAIKVSVVQQDPQEKGAREVLNFGHTVAHALESATRYQVYRHGEAVAIGMVAAAFLAVDLGVASPDLPSQVSELLLRHELPVGCPTPPAELLPYLGRDKKRRKGRGRWVLVARPGTTVTVEEPDAGSVLRALEAVHDPAAAP